MKIYGEDYSEQPTIEFNRLNSGILAFTGLAFPIGLFHLFFGGYNIRTDSRTLQQRREDRRAQYLADLKRGAEITKTHLQKISPEEASSVKSVYITPSSERRILGTFIKEKPLEVVVENQNE